MGGEQEIAAAGALAWIDWGLVTGIVVAAVSRFWPRESIESRREKLNKAEFYRERAAEALTQQDFGHVYCQALRRALILAWRIYGRRNGPLALGVSLWLALAYSWLLFWLIWGWLGPDEARVARGVLLVTPAETRIWLGPVTGLSPILVTVAAWFMALGLRRSEDQFTATWTAAKRWSYRVALGVFAGLCVSVVIETWTSWGDAFAKSLLLSGISILGVMVTNVFERSPWGPWIGAELARLVSMLALAVALVVVGAVANASAVVVAGAVAVFVVGAGFVSIAVALVVAGAFVISVVIPIAGAEVVTGAVAVAFAGAGATAELIKSGKNHLLNIPLAGATGIVVSWGVVVGIASNTELSLIFSSFFLLLPLANGFTDWGSWWVSRRLGSELRNRLRRPHTGREFAALVLRHGLYDLGLALGFFALLAILLAFAFESVDLLAAFKDIDVSQTIADAAGKPFTDGLWLTAMLFSTLMPTAVHLLFLVASPFALFSRGRDDRETWARALQPAMFATLNDEQKYTLTTEVAEWQAKRHPARWAFASMLTLGLFALAGWLIHLIATLATGQDRGFADLVAWIAGFGVWLARLLF